MELAAIWYNLMKPESRQARGLQKHGDFCGNANYCKGAKVDLGPKTYGPDVGRRKQENLFVLLSNSLMCSWYWMGIEKEP